MSSGTPTPGTPAPGNGVSRVRAAHVARRSASAIDVVPPSGPRRAQRFSRRRGVLAAFAVFAAVGFVAAYVGPAGAALAEVDAEKVSLYESARFDVQTYVVVSEPGSAPAPASLERGGYDVYVTPKPTPTPTAKAATSARGGSAGGSGGAWRPPFVSPDPGTAQAIAYDMVKARGWGDDQFACLQALWNKESGWRVNAYNAGSGAYGIPQALPGSKMASVAADWETNPATQITWGLGYISGRYGDPCGAWGSSQSRGWY